MTCSKITDMIYEDGSISLSNRFQIWAHTAFCPDCAKKIERLESAKEMLREDFFPQTPELEDLIMARIAVIENEEESYENPAYAAAGGLSTRGWVIAGFIILVSLVTAYFGFDFQSLSNELGASFILPVGITVGIVVTSYGAFFIGSHLKELSERFGL
ncbi:MAG: peptidoglycan-binding protein [Treponema sp.]|nr:peptidoglycan-binding protein [Treponema sp.]